MSDSKPKLWVVQVDREYGYKPPIYVVATNLYSALEAFQRSYPARSPQSIQDLDVDLVTG